MQLYKTKKMPISLLSPHILLRKSLLPSTVIQDMTLSNECLLSQFKLMQL